MLDFIGIGARRAGEDWLFEQLRRHPEIHFPRELELSFWSQHHPRSLTEPDYARNLDWYRSVFAHWQDGYSPAVKQHERPIDAAHTTYKRGWFDKLMAALDRAGGQGDARLADLEQPAEEKEQVVQAAAKLGDFSPTYCWFDDEATLEAIHTFAPHARVIYLVRHPHDRAWAAAEKLRELAGLSAQEVSDGWYLDHFNSAQSLKHGDYARSVSQWQPHYGDALLVMPYEDISRDPHAVLRTICKLIGVADTAYFDSEPAEILTKTLTSPAPIRDSLRPALHELYADKLKQLHRLTGIHYQDV